MLKHVNIQPWIRIIIIVLVILLVVWLLTERHGAENIALSTLPSIQDNLRNRTELRKEKNQLIEENSQLRAENLQYSATIDMLVEENQSLLEKGEISRYWGRNPGICGETARVFLKDPYGLYSTFLIDKGSNHGIKQDMPVLGLKEVIGRVIEVHPEFSRVRSILSPNLAFGAVIKRTRELGVFEGGRGFQKLTYLTINSSVRPGDEIITSGTTDITPAGLPLGQVKEIIRMEQEEELIVMVESSENIGKLSHVLVVTSVQSVHPNASIEGNNS